MFYNESPRYKEALPDVFQNIVEIDNLDKAIKIQLNKLNTLINDSISNKSVQTATEQGVGRWEKILGVTSPLNSTLQARREALKSKLMTKPPINLITLKNIIETYMGVEVVIEIKDFVARVRYRGTSKVADLNPLYATAYQTIPANLILDIAYAFLTFGELDALSITFGELESKNINFEQLAKGEWI